MGSGFGVTSNSTNTGIRSSGIQGMVDSHLYHNSLATWPVPLTYVQIDTADKAKTIHLMDHNEARDKIAYIDGTESRSMPTAEAGDHLVLLNS